MSWSLLRRSLLWWFGGYAAITVINSILTLGYGVLLAASLGGAGYDVAYQRTVPVHILLGAALWILAGMSLWRSSPASESTTRNSAAVAGLWLVAAALVDAVVFVGLLADTPAGAPASVFYVQNQPWTALYYVAVLVGPPVGLACWRSWPRRHTAR